MRRVLSIVAALLLATCLLPGAAGAATAPTITSPAEGAYLTSGTPAFSGTAAANGDHIAVNVYSGATATGLPATVLATTVSNGSWTVSPPFKLADGVYTADAADLSSGDATGQAVTFTIFGSTPGLTLSVPSSTVSTPSPTFTGTAPTGPTETQTVVITIYAGSTTDATPLSQVQGSVGTNGSFSIQASPGLANGTYTAVAGQILSDGSSDFSPPVTFMVNAAAPALTITDPAQHGSEAQTAVTFAGAAGDNYGDAQSIVVTLFPGAGTRATPLGTKTVTPSDGRWQLSWPQRLALGTYTVVATQSNIIGETTTVTRTFTVSPPGVLKGTPAISAAGVISAVIACPGGPGTCSGDILILTRSKLQPVAGGPVGALRLLFRHYSVKGGATATLTARLSQAQVDALRRAGAEKLTVTTVYALGPKLTEISAVTAAVKVA